MRPIHSLLVVVAVVALAAVSWWAVGGEEVRPHVASVAPEVEHGEEVPAEQIELSRPEALAETQTASSERVAIEEPAPSPEPAAAETVRPSLIGTVLDQAGQPVAGARVLVLSSEGLGLQQPLDVAASAGWLKPREAFSNDAGEFEVERLRAGTVRLAVRAAGFAPHDANNLLLPAGGAHELEAIVLKPSVILSGRVVTEDGRGVAGAEITRMAEHQQGIMIGGALGHAGAVIATTASDGTFTVNQLASGSFSLKVSHADHPDRIEAGKTYQAGERVDGLMIVVEYGFQIHGRMTGIPDGMAGTLSVSASPDFGDSSGRIVLQTMAGSGGAFAAESRRAPLEDDGRFVLRGLREGQRYALAGRRERTNRGLDIFSSPSISPRILASPGDRGIELAYKPAGAFLFQVVDARTSEPITEYQIEGGSGWMTPRRRDGQLDYQHPDGRGRLDNLRPKSEDTKFKLRIRAVGYRDETLTGLSLQVGQEFDLGIIALEPMPLLRVTVTDDATGIPVRGARVSLVAAKELVEGFTMEHTMDIDIGPDHSEPQVVMGGDGARTAVTDADGLALLTSFAGESAVLTVAHRSFAPYRGQPFEASATSNEELAISLGQGGSVTVTMLTASGAPLAGGRVDHRAPGQDGQFATIIHGVAGGNVTDAEGRVTFSHLETGTHSFRPEQDSNSFAFGGDEGNMRFRVRRSGAPEGPREPGWEEVYVTEGSVAEVALTAPVRVFVEGRITERGIPLEGASIKLVDARAAGRDPLMGMFGEQRGPEARTDGKGYYKLENVKSGEYTVQVSHPDRLMPTEVPLSLGDESRFLDLDLSVTIVEGKVTDLGGAPLEGIRVWPEVVRDDGDAPRAMMIAVMVTDDGGGASDEVITMSDGSLGGQQTVTDANGNYSLRGVRDGVDIVIKAEGSAVMPGGSSILNLDPDERQQNVDIELGAAGKIEVVCWLADGKAASNLLVIARWDGPEDPDLERKTGFMQSGSTTLDGLTPGPWLVEVQDISGLGSDETEAIPEQLIQVVAGETQVATFQVP